MPEIALGGLSALDVPPGRVKPARRNGPPRRDRKAGPRFRKFRAHAALVVGSAAFSALMIGIVLNATVMQKEHHPAPLFGSAAAPMRAAAAAPSQPAPPPPVTLAPASPAVEEAAPPPAAPKMHAAPAAPASPPKTRSAPVTHRPVKGNDAIAHLLGRAAPASSPKGAAASAKAAAAPVQPVHGRPLPPAR